MTSLFNVLAIFAAIIIVNGPFSVDGKNFDYLKAVYNTNSRKWVVQFAAAGSPDLQEKEIFYNASEKVYYFNYCVGTFLSKNCKSIKLNVSKLSANDQLHLWAYASNYATRRVQHYTWGKSIWHTNVPGEFREPGIDSDNPSDDEY
ncbi:hypothetical protein DdX_13342 [Ditylenchus destructor]|uniref:Uncharacterized protein n=1 Tax=Ditylenchus destructor TaxID=166010 RepID=A0AAD4MT29_9BILA|nr:hypothetical protein DdX_13342 [Ditylenchus destructor]